MKKEYDGPPLHIESAQIPDSDFINWMKMFRESKELTDEEIEHVLVVLNETYRKEKMIKPAVKETMKVVEKELTAVGKPLDEEEKVAFQKHLEEVLESQFRASRSS